MSSRQPLLQVTSDPCGLGFKIPAQLGSSFFSFVNYFALAPWRGFMFAWPALVQWPGCAPAGPLPCPAQPLLPPAAAATARGSHEGPGILAGVGRQRAAGGALEKAANVNQKARDWQRGGPAWPGLRPGGAWVWGDPSMSSPGQKLKAFAGK